MVDKQLIQPFIEHKTIISLGKYFIVSQKLQDNESTGKAVMVNTIVKATVIIHFVLEFLGLAGVRVRECREKNSETILILSAHSLQG